MTDELTDTITSNPDARARRKIALFANSHTQLAHCCRIVKETNVDNQFVFDILYLDSDAAFAEGLKKSHSMLGDSDVRIVDMRKTWLQEHHGQLRDFSVTKGLYFRLLDLVLDLWSRWRRTNPR